MSALQRHGDGRSWSKAALRRRMALPFAGARPIADMTQWIWKARSRGEKRGRSPEPARWPRHILVLNWRDPWHPHAGGAEIMLYEHVTRWQRAGHRITVFTAHYPGAGREEMRDGMHIVRRGGRFTVYVWAPLLYALRFRRRVDAVLDIENGIPFFTPLYSRKPRLCLVHHVHRDQFFSELGPVVAWVGRFLECTLMPFVYRRTRFLAVSESTRRELAQIGVPPSRCRVVHNGLDHGAYRRTIARSPSPRLLYLGRLKRHKRVDLVIDMCARLLADVPDLVLDIVGTGDDEARLRALVAARGLGRSIRFHGFASHQRKIALYSRAWALVTATQREGWGLSIMEAAACGTPTFCLDVPGVRDAVEHGVSGWCARDMEALRLQVLRALQDPEWRERLSEGATRRAQLFSWDVSAARTREALADAWLAGTSVRRRSAHDHLTSATLVIPRPRLPEPAWQVAELAMRRTLRVDDTVRTREDEIRIEVKLCSDAELAEVERRVQQALGGVSSGRLEPARGHEALQLSRA